MANLKDLIVSGPIRAISGVIGDVTGTASKATGDKDGNQIDTTYVKTSRKVNNKALSADITLTYTDVAAASTSHTHSGYVSTNTMRCTEFIVGTQTGTTKDWTGVTEDSSLYDGKNINYFLNQTSAANATLNLTLAGGTTTGAKPVYLNGTSYVGTHFPINSLVNLTYNATKGAWFVNSYRDTNDNTYDRVKNSNNVYAVAACTNGKLIVGTKSGYKDIAASVTFDIEYPVLYCGTAVAATKTTNNTYLSFPGVNLQTTKASWTGTQWSVVYLVGTLSGTTFTIDSTVFTTTVPTTADGKVYMPIGVLYSTYQTFFVSSKDLYAYINGSFKRLEPDLSTYQKSNTAVTHTASTAVGSTVKPVYIASNGTATALNATVGSTIKPVYMNGGTITEIGYTIAKSVPSDANFSNTTYTAGTGLSLSGTQFKHSNSVTAATAGTTAATSGSTLAVPYVTYDAQGHITATGTHTHTVTGFLTGHQTIKVNGVTGATSNNFGTCSTAAATAEKAVTLTAGTFNLETGARVVVKFTVTNTAANPTLNVGGKGAKAIQYRGSAISAGILAANRTYEFVYDGSNFQLIGDTDTNSNDCVAQNISTANNTYPMLLGNTANATANIGNKAALFGSGIKANPNTSQIVANSYALGTNVTMQYNSTTEAIEFVFA